ncbi:MAG: DUF3368 domain-containing protein [Firmicutes bacterium]|jgi:predicted nucleic acid-binding protein|nr:DUF3368 domain-containing protein [Bacillota bacterium]
MPGAVADSSALIGLAAIGRLSLLKDFHQRILVPPAVWREVVVEGGNKPGVGEVQKAVSQGWIEIISPKNEDLVRLLKADLDEGEAEAIALAIEIKAEIVFIDEAEARRTAEVYGLRKAGVVGVLLRAKVEGKVGSLRSELSKLRKAGFRLCEEVSQRVLQEAGESE